MDFSRQTSCQAVPAHLASLLDFLVMTCRDAGLDDETTFAIRLAGEEACCNVIDHAYEGIAAGPITLELNVRDDAITLIVEDRAPTFHPEAVPAPDLSNDWENRRVGGLGWHLMHQFMDKVEHQPLEGGGNRLTLSKNRLSGAPPSGQDGRS